MKKYLAAVALAATLAQPASAITFSKLTTIYIGSGVRDDGSGGGAGTATTFHCSNVSGVTAQIRFLVLGSGGLVEGDSVTLPAVHGRTVTVATHGVVAYFEDETLETNSVQQGVINIESTQSGVFCTAMTIDASLASPVGVPLHLVRVNPHPGTVE